MTIDGVPDLAGLCADLAAGLDEVSSEVEGDGAVYRRGMVDFARVWTTALEVRLPADIAEAALRTADVTRATERGWIRFAPRGQERHVTDRATAWFHTAWRHAEGE